MEKGGMWKRLLSSLLDPQQPRAHSCQQNVSCFWSPRTRSLFSFSPALSPILFFSSFSFLCFFSWPPPRRLMFHEFCFCSTVYYFKLHYLFYSSAKTLHNFAAVLSCPFEFLCFFIFCLSLYVLSISEFLASTSLCFFTSFS